MAKHGLNESVLRGVHKTIKKLISMNESLSSIDPETYRDFCRDVYTAVSDVCFEYSNFGLSESDIISAVEEFKDGFFDSEYDDDNLSESYDLYILKGDKEVLTILFPLYILQVVI